MRFRPWRAVLGVTAFTRWLARSKNNRRKFVLGAFTLALVAGVTADLLLPDRHLLWRGLHIDDVPGIATRLKLRAIDLGPASWCRQLLANSTTFVTQTLDAHDGKGRCGWSEAVHITASGPVTLTGKSRYAMQCPLAAGVHIWLNGLDRRARLTLGSGIVRAHHAGSYSCRRMYNRADAPMSQHAFANAWDVTGFELEDGRVISVLKHWDERNALGRFLHAARDDACRVFNVVLGPQFNAAHRDHFHLDMGRGSRCR